MHKLTRRQILTAAGAVAAAAVAGCSGDAPEESQDLSGNRAGAMDDFAVGKQFTAAEPLTFSIMMLSNPGYPYKATWPFFTELTNRTKVKLDPTVVPLSDYNQKRSVVVSSGNAPLIIPKTYHPDEEAYIAGGAIIPVSDYVTLMPHFQDKVKRWKLEGNLASISQQDGKYYLLPGLHENVWQDYSLAVRTDILQQLGLAVPKTWDELTTVLRAMKQAHPGVYPMSDRWSTPPQPGANNLFNLVGSAYGTYAGWGWDSAFWDAQAGKFVYTGAMPQYRQTLEYLALLVREKLLDPESFTQTDDLARQKFATGKSFVISCNAQTLVNECRKDIARIPGATVVKIPLPTGPVGATLDGRDRLENGIMISRQARESKNFVAMMQFIDWLWYSDAGVTFSKWGIQGQTYTGNVDDGTFQLSKDVKWAGLNPGATKDLQVDYGYFNGVFAYGGSTKLLNSQFPLEEQAFQAEMNKRPARPIAPPHPFSPEEREQVTLWETALEDHVNQQSLRFVLGQRPLTEWDAYRAELKGKNMDQYVDLANKAYERYK